MKIKISEIFSNNIYILKYVKKACPFFILLTILISFTAFVDTVSNTWLSKIVFDGMANGTDYKIIVMSVLVLFGMLFLSSITKTWFYQKKTPVANEKIKLFMRTLLLNKTRELDLECYENAEFYNNYTRALSEAENRVFSVMGSLTGLSYSLITLFTLFSIIIYLDPILIIFAAVGAVISVVLNIVLSKLRYKYIMERTPFDRNAAYIHRIFYEPQYAKDIKMDNMFSYFINSYKNIIDSTIKLIRSKTTKIAILEFLAAISTVVLQLVMILFLTYRVYSGYISIGDYAALLNSTFSLMSQLNNLFNLIPQFYQHSLFISNIRNVMNMIPSIEKDEGIELDAGSDIVIEFKNVSFEYPNTAGMVLKNVSFIIKNGEKVAIVGHNGAGKSTIVKLLLRLYDVTKGEILINNINIKEYNILKLRIYFATVFQDFQPYATRIADSILCKKCDGSSDEDRVREALRNVGLNDKVQALKKGIYSNLTKEFDMDGVILSGGELQKLALSKAFAKNASVIILDEPSSALDPISEYEMHNNMMKIAKDNIMILISHRLSTTKDADYILYIENGEIVERGKHNELMELNSKYNKMFTVQAMNYQISDNLHNKIQAQTFA